MYPDSRQSSVNTFYIYKNLFNVEATHEQGKIRTLFTLLPLLALSSIKSRTRNPIKRSEQPRLYTFGYRKKTQESHSHIFEQLGKICSPSILTSL